MGERGVECIFIGYAEHSKAYRFYVIEPNKSISVHTVIESRDAIFDEKRFSLTPIVKDVVPKYNGDNEAVPSTSGDNDMNVTPRNSEPEIRKSKRVRKGTSFGPDFLVYLVE